MSETRSDDAPENPLPEDGVTPDSGVGAAQTEQGAQFAAGGAQPAAGGAQPAPGSAQPQAASTESVSPTTKSNLLIAGIAVGVSLLLLIIGIVAINIIKQRSYSPEAKVSEYLQAIVDGKAEAATKLYKPNVGDDKLGLLSDDVYGNVKNRPTSFELAPTPTESGPHDNDYGFVMATVTQNGKRYQVPFSLQRTGTTFLFFPEWKITAAPETYISVEAAPKEVVVNDVDTTLSPATVAGEPGQKEAADDSEKEYSSDDTPGLMPALPGTYVFTPPENSKLFSWGKPVKVTVFPAENPGERQTANESVRFTPELSAAAKKTATAQVSKAFERCISDDNTVVVKGCEAVSFHPYGKQAMQVKSRSWDQKPKFDVYERESGEYVVQVSDASVNLNYQYRWDEDDDWKDNDVVITKLSTLDFPITIKGDTLTVDMSALHEVPRNLPKEFRN